MQAHSDFMNLHSFLTPTPAFSYLVSPAGLYNAQQLYTSESLEERGLGVTRNPPDASELHASFVCGKVNRDVEM